MDGHLGGFYLSIIVSYASVDGCAKISLRCYYFGGPRVYLFLHILALVRNISLYTITPHVKEKAKKHISDSNFFCLFIRAVIYSLIPNISPAIDHV